MSDPALPKYLIRLACLDDLESIQGVERRASTRFLGWEQATGWPASRWQRVCSRRALKRYLVEGMLWVTEMALPESGENSIVGFVAVSLRTFDGKQGVYLEEIDVVPEHGRRGLGSAMLANVCRWAKARDYTCLGLHTFRTIPWNAPWYERHGFKPAEELSMDTVGGSAAFSGGLPTRGINLLASGHCKETSQQRVFMIRQLAVD